VLTETDRGALLELMKRYDVVWVHNVRTANLAQLDRWPHSVLDVDDIPSRYFRSLSQSRDNPARRLLDLRTSVHPKRVATDQTGRSERGIATGWSKAAMYFRQSRRRGSRS
jgi:hypothetical protein